MIANLRFTIDYEVGSMMIKTDDCSGRNCVKYIYKYTENICAKNVTYIVLNEITRFRSKFFQLFRLPSSRISCTEMPITGEP